MLLIVDDIQVGCGRTGTFFSFEGRRHPAGHHHAVEVAVGLRPAHVAGADEPELDVWKPGAHSGTFRGNNLAFVTATQALETYWTNAAFSAEIQRKESLVRDWLENLVHSFPTPACRVRVAA